MGTYEDDLLDVRMLLLPGLIPLWRRPYAWRNARSVGTKRVTGICSLLITK